MNSVYRMIGWIWSRKLFFAIIMTSAAIFFAWMFPFGDLSDVVASRVAEASGGSLYIQFDQLNLHLLPKPAISATNVTVESTFSPFLAKWIKFTPGLLDALGSIPTMMKAAGGNAEAAASLGTKIGAAIEAEGVFGGDAQFTLRPGSRGEGGRERSHVSLALDKMNLHELQAWADLPVKMSGSLGLTTDVQFAPDFLEQPEGEYDLKINKLNLPAGTVMVPLNGVLMPLNVPLITLANVRFRGRVTGGKFFIEEGSFGQNRDPLYGRIKGNLAIRLQPHGANLQLVLGAYDFSVDLTTTQMIEKELNFAFFLFGPGKSALPGGGAHYLFKAQGATFDGGTPPSITRIATF